MRTYYAPFAFTPDGKRLLFRSELGGVQVFNLETLQEELALKAPADSMGWATALSPDGETLAWVLPDYSIQLVRLANGRLLHTLTGHTDIVTKLKFTPDGKQLVSASHDTWVRVWEVASGQELRAFQPAEPGYAKSDVLGIGLSPDGMRLAALPFDGPVSIWDIGSAQEIAALGGSGGYDTSDVEYSPDGQYVASDLATGLALWRVSDRAQLLSGINSMAFTFSPDGRFLAYSDIAEENSVVLSSPDGTQKLRSLGGHAAPVWQILFSPDGTLLVSADDAEVRLWRAVDGVLLAVGKAACP